VISLKRFRYIISLLILSLSPSLFGQAVNATLLGTVTDSTGATVAGAKVTATEAATGLIHESVTNESGNFTFPDMQPGTYSVTAEAKGFKKDTHQNIDLLSNSSTRVDVAMVTGSVSEEVLVTTAPPVLQTDRADISIKLEAKQLADAPVSTNRNFQSLLNLVPGMAPATFQHSQFFNAASSLQTQANGLPREGNLYQIEGIDDDERTGLLQIIIPPLEAIQSVDVSTNNFEAELGRATGAVTNVILKSGTNAFHGSAFEYIQNSAVNARSYFGGPLGHLSYNYYGGSIGGPIFKDKLFFFVDYLGTSDHERVGSTFTIPDPRYYTQNSSGNIDLSAALSGTTGQIYDPATGDGNGTTPGHQRTPFVNNQLPFNRVNQVSLKILQMVNAAALANGILIRPITTRPIFHLQRAQTASIQKSTGRSMSGTISAVVSAISESTPFRRPHSVRFWVVRQEVASKVQAFRRPIARVLTTTTYFHPRFSPKHASASLTCATMQPRTTTAITTQPPWVSPA
jgi:hypothetical protein